MPIVTWGYGIDGGTGFGARLLTHSIDLYAIAKPASSFSVDLIVGDPLVAVQVTETYVADLLVDNSRTVRYEMDALAIDPLLSDEGWGENYI